MVGRAWNIQKVLFNLPLSEFLVLFLELFDLPLLHLELRFEQSVRCFELVDLNSVLFVALLKLCYCGLSLIEKSCEDTDELLVLAAKILEFLNLEF